jgi:hypothetical protein
MQLNEVASGSGGICDTRGGRISTGGVFGHPGGLVFPGSSGSENLGMNFIISAGGTA